jgi:S-adenosylmethionine/arginine decarboxylase-like enzyme
MFYNEIHILIFTEGCDERVEKQAYPLRIQQSYENTKLQYLRCLLCKSQREQKDYIAYIDEQLYSERLTKILCDVTDIIGAHVLNISKQDYDRKAQALQYSLQRNLCLFI